MAADSADSLSCFRFIIIFCNVCTSSEWNSVKRIFLGSARDVGRYPSLSRHNQPSMSPMTIRQQRHHCCVCVCLVVLHPLVFLSVLDPLSCPSFTPSLTALPPRQPTRALKCLCHSGCLVLANSLNDLECNRQGGCRRQDPDSCTTDDKTRLFVDSCASKIPSLMTSLIQEAIRSCPIYVVMLRALSRKALVDRGRPHKDTMDKSCGIGHVTQSSFVKCCLRRYRSCWMDSLHNSIPNHFRTIPSRTVVKYHKTTTVPS